MSNPILNAPTPNQIKLDILREHFPQAIETDADGRIRINAPALQMALDPANPAGLQVEEDGFELRWVGKREAYHSAFVPVQKILEPAPEQSKNWDSTGNLLIKGDNLDALRLLRHSYFGKVKLIYIDPPYNTQSDAFIYRDDFSARQSEVLAQLGYAKENIDYIKNIYGARTHSGWLSFMYPRLLLAKDLLRDDGVIFISIDDNEQAQLKLLCDEVFGQENFVSQLAWKSRASEDTRATTGVSTDHEYVLVYSGQSDVSLRGVSKDLQKFSNPDNDARGDWRSADLTGLASKDARPNLHYDLINPITGINYGCGERGWRYEPSTMAKKITEGRILFPESAQGRPRHKLFLEETSSLYKNMSSVLTGHTTAGGTREVSAHIGRSTFPFPKPIGLIKQFIEQTTSESDLVLDFFAGSGTTAEAVMRLNLEDGGTRQFILVQIPQPIDPKKQKEAHHFVTQTLGKREATIFEITAERIRRAGAKIEAEQAAKTQAAALHPIQLEGFAPEAAPQEIAVDTGFRVFELVNDPDALILQKPLQQATQADVLALLAAIATPQPAQLPRVLYNLLLSDGLPLTTPLRTIKDQHLYLASDVALIVKAMPLAELTDIFRALQDQGTTVNYLTVYAPWIEDDNVMLGIKTMAETLGYSADKLRLRG